MVVLRPYQADIITETRALMARGIHSILIESPTGSGKTALTAQMLKTASSRGFTSWFINHRRELIKQSCIAFHDAAINAGVIAAGFKEDRRQSIQIASIQTLLRRYHKYVSPSLIIWDEAHHLGAKSWDSLYKAFPKAFHIGLTATPQRLDGQGLSKWFKSMVMGPSVSWLIENGFLAPYRLFSPPGIDTSQMRIKMGDFDKGELNVAADKPTITGDAIKHYLKHARSQRALVFCVSIEHSKHVVSQFLAAGISAAHVDGETEAHERDEKIKSFERGKTLVLSNVDLFGEGFNVPSAVVAILLRPTTSVGLFLQQCGRVLRPYPGKQAAIILDHCGNAQRHGLPDDEREWSLDGLATRKHKGDLSNLSVRICPKCFAAQKSGALQCQYCAFVFEIEARKVEEVEGNLEEVDIEAQRRERKREQGQATTLQELIELGRRRGYKYPSRWAYHLHQVRQAKKIGRVA